MNFSVLEPSGIRISAYTVEIDGVRAAGLDPEAALQNPFFCPDPEAAARMAERLEACRRQGDSLGGIVETRVTGCPPGLGEPVFDKLDAELARAFMSVGAQTSSQHASSLLLAAPYANRDTEVHVQGEAVSRPYVDLTIRVMEAFGVNVDCTGDRRFRVPSGVCYRAGTRRIEGDASTASYFWPAAAVTGGRVVTRNLFPFQTAQGDIRFLEILERMGCRVRRQPDHVEVQGGPLRGVSVDMGDLPDMVPTLAAVALFARGRTRIRNAAHLRYKESDRLHAIAEQWQRLGGCVEMQEDGLVIHGGSRLRGEDLDSKNDHRIAMSLAVAGLRVPGIRIRNPACVDKSFPAFWPCWDALELSPPPRNAPPPSGP